LAYAATANHALVPMSFGSKPPSIWPATLISSVSEVWTSASSRWRHGLPSGALVGRSMPPK
jgi:hypothetical protein